MRSKRNEAPVLAKTHSRRSTGASASNLTARVPVGSRDTPTLVLHISPSCRYCSRSPEARTFGANRPPSATLRVCLVSLSDP